MKKIFRFLCLTTLLPLTAHAIPLDPSKLIKVTNENNPKCVEYYNYKNAMYCSTVALSPNSDPNLKNYETQKIIFDDRVWKAAWGKQDDKISMVEYVPSGDDINHWNELVTSQFFPNMPDITARAFTDEFLKGISSAGFSPITKFYQESPDQVIFEFRIVNPTNQQQDELQKIVKGKKGFYVLHYVIKKSDMDDKIRQQWLKNLKDSTIKS